MATTNLVATTITFTDRFISNRYSQHWSVWKVCYPCFWLCEMCVGVSTRCTRKTQPLLLADAVQHISLLGPSPKGRQGKGERANRGEEGGHQLLVATWLTHLRKFKNPHVADINRHMDAKHLCLHFFPIQIFNQLFRIVRILVCRRIRIFPNGSIRRIEFIPIVFKLLSRSFCNQMRKGDFGVDPAVDLFIFACILSQDQRLLSAAEQKERKSAERQSSLANLAFCIGRVWELGSSSTYPAASCSCVGIRLTYSILFYMKKLYDHAYRKDNWFESCVFVDVTMYCAIVRDVGISYCS